MPAPNLRTVRRSRSQSVETASGVFMVSPKLWMTGRSLARLARKSQKSDSKLGSVRRLAGCATSRQALPATLAQRPALKLTFEVDAEPISPPKPCWYKPPAAPPRPQAPCSQPCSSPQPLTRIAPPLLAQLVALDLAGRRARQIVGNFEPPRPLVRRQRPRQPFACGRHRRRAVSAGRRNDIEHDLREPDFAFAACLPRPGRRPRSSPR